MPSAARGLVSLASALSPGRGEKRSRAVLIEVDPGNDALLGERRFAFQYFPESLSDSKSAEYDEATVAGGSLPVLGWKNSSSRVLTFTARFSCDMDLIQPGPKTGLGVSADSFLNGADTFETLRDLKEDHRNVDIRAAVVWLRRFLLPTYKKGSSQVGTLLTQAPRKCALWLAGSGIGLAGGDDEALVAQNPDMVLCVMTQCDVEWRAYFPSGLPRLADVSLSFTQCASLQGKINFPAATPYLQELVESGKTFGGDAKVYPYTLRPVLKG